MDCFKDPSSPREAFFAIQYVRILPSFVGAALIRYPINNRRRIMPVKSFSGFP
jgi:hypothetical protein